MTTYHCDQILEKHSMKLSFICLKNLSITLIIT